MKHSGRTISLAPALAASRTLTRAWLRFAALSAPRHHYLLVYSLRGLKCKNIPDASCMRASLRGCLRSVVMTEPVLDCCLTMSIIES